MANRVTIQDVFMALPQSFWSEAPLEPHKKKMMWAIMDCGTGAFGHTIVQCQCCGHVQSIPRGCHSRNCPMCISAEANQWVDKQEEKLLPTPYFHVIMTMPATLRDLARHNPKEMYALLMRASQDTLLYFFATKKPLGCIPAILQLLHTWNQKLEHHPHVHMVVSGGGFNVKNQQWVPCRNEKFLFPGKAVAKVLRGKLMEGLKALKVNGKLDFTHPSVAPLENELGWQCLVDDLYHQRWNVHIKPPWGGPHQVIRYLARYTHRTAISNKRILAVQDGMVTFSYTNRKAGRRESRTLSVEHFANLFATHILPKGFHRIRTAGLLATNSNARFESALKAACEHEGIDVSAPKAETMEAEVPTPKKCTACGEEQLVCLYSILPNGMHVGFLNDPSNSSSKRPPNPACAAASAEGVA